MLRIFLSLVLVLAPLAAFAQDKAPGSLSPEKIAEIEKLVTRSMADGKIPAVSIAIGLDNKLAYENAFGESDIENHVKATSRTKFRTASIAKTMTAALALKLVDLGLLDLDKPIQDYYPAYPKKEWPITTRQLLGHLSGVRHYKDDPFESSSPKHYANTDAAIAYFAKDPLLHEPETKYLYSSFGYNLLGGVIEKAGGGDFMSLLKEHVIAPAGMTETVEDSTFAIIDGRTRGYMLLAPQRARLIGLPQSLVGKVVNAELHDTSMKIPGGGLLSTSADLVRFASALGNNRIVTSTSLAQMWTEQKTKEGKPTGYGLGWGVGKFRDLKTVSHSGGQAGTATYYVYAPDRGITVAVMCNLQSAKVGKIAEAILGIVTDQRVATDYSDVIERLKQVVEREVEQKNLPAFSICLVDGDKQVWAEGFGFEDKEKKRPASAETIYRVGSVSKLFTDIAVMQLVEQGKVDLDAPVQTYLPEFKPKNTFGGDITLRRLMSHFSGLVREPPVGHYFDPTNPTLDATVASLNNTALVYEPGARTKYSNAAIAVVGQVLEKQLTQSHPAQVEATILKPLGMTSSSFDLTPKVKEHLATAYMRTYDGRRFEAPTFLLGTGPAGNMYASVTDLGKFMSCLFRNGKYEGGEILSEKGLAEMLSPVRDKEGRPQSFGLGFMLQNLEGHKQIGHGGAVYGFSTQLEALPEPKLGVAAVAAVDGSNGVVARIAKYALRLMLAKKSGKPMPAYLTTTKISPERIRQIKGLYTATDGETWARIFDNQGTVYYRNGVYEMELRAAEHDGSLVVDDFVTAGELVRWRADGTLALGRLTLERVDEAKPPAAPRDHWKGLIGEYGWDHDVLYILEDRGQLYALIEWFDYYPLTQLNDDTYAFPDYGLYHGELLKFARDKEGEATHVVAAEVKFDRRKVGTKHGETFKITPVKPIAELREAALAASPPEEKGDFEKSNLVDLSTIDPTLKFDIRYATNNNFVGTPFYKEAKAYLQRPAADALSRAHIKLREKGYGLLIHDAYRPWHVTKMFWDATPVEQHDFVADPSKGSRHNRGCAVDLTLCDLKTGKPVEMVGGYDEFSPRSFPLYPGGTAQQRWHRQLLRDTMEAEGFEVYEFEWWHFDYKDWKKYRIGNATFEELAKLKG